MSSAAIGWPSGVWYRGSSSLPPRATCSATPCRSGIVISAKPAWAKDPEELAEDERGLVGEDVLQVVRGPHRIDRGVRDDGHVHHARDDVRHHRRIDVEPQLVPLGVLESLVKALAVQSDRTRRAARPSSRRAAPASPDPFDASPALGASAHPPLAPLDLFRVHNGRRARTVLPDPPSLHSRGKSDHRTRTFRLARDHHRLSAVRASARRHAPGQARGPRDRLRTAPGRSLRSRIAARTTTARSSRASWTRRTAPSSARGTGPVST